MRLEWTALAVALAILSGCISDGAPVTRTDSPSAAELRVPAASGSVGVDQNATSERPADGDGARAPTLFRLPAGHFAVVNGSMRGGVVTPWINLSFEAGDGGAGSATLFIWRASRLVGWGVVAGYAQRIEVAAYGPFGEVLARNVTNEGGTGWSNLSFDIRDVGERGGPEEIKILLAMSDGRGTLIGGASWEGNVTSLEVFEGEGARMVAMSAFYEDAAALSATAPVPRTGTTAAASLNGPSEYRFHSDFGLTGLLLPPSGIQTGVSRVSFENSNGDRDSLTQSRAAMTAFSQRAGEPPLLHASGLPFSSDATAWRFRIEASTAAGTGETLPRLYLVPFAP